MPNLLVNTTSNDKRRLVAAIHSMLNNFEMDSDQLLPAQVISFDRTKNLATVKPLIMVVTVDDQHISRDSIAYVPVISLGGGGFHISFPLKQGDLGWIIASDRDLSLFQQNLSESTPNTGRIHDFADSWFIPDVFRKYTINGADSAAMVIQSTDGTTRVSISEGVINITAPTSVTVTTPQATFSQNVEIKGNLTVDQNATVTQQMTANGGFTSASGTNCTLPANTTCGGINVSNHGHNGVQSGGSRTTDGMVA